MCVRLAWVLGLWLAAGDADRAAITRDHNHASIIERLKSWSSDMAGPCGGIVDAPDAENQICSIRLGVAFERLLHSYDLVKTKHFPSQLLQDSPAVRRHLLAGVIDGDGCDRDHRYEVSGKDRRFIDGLVHLARGLGFTTGRIRPCDKSNTEQYNRFWRRTSKRGLRRCEVPSRTSGVPASPSRNDRPAIGTVSLSASRMDHPVTVDY
jgi:hypothetical protein